MNVITTSQPKQRQPSHRKETFLDRVIPLQRERIATSQEAVPLDELERQANRNPKPRGFADQLKNQAQQQQYALIAELKTASPSRGVIRKGFDYAALARAYQAGGATCLSVLTEPEFFAGDLSHIKIAAEATSLPILRKDFIVDPYQVVEARAYRADAILLIMSVLDEIQAQELAQLARRHDMDVLAEIHDESELDKALSLPEAVIGINNRNLKTLEVSLNTTERLKPKIPNDRLVVSASGFRAHDELVRMTQVGVYCFLVGESLMSEADVSAATRALLG